MQNTFLALCILYFPFFVGACSVPNLEDPVCTESRTAIREFYSFHFGNEMRISQENIKDRQRFLTPRFYQELSNTQADTDPFTTGTNEVPKAFRVGECHVVAPDKVEFQVLLFWRDDVRSEQREIKAVLVKQGDKWLLDSVNR